MLKGCGSCLVPAMRAILVLKGERRQTETEKKRRVKLGSVSPRKESEMGEGNGCRGQRMNEGIG